MQIVSIRDNLHEMSNSVFCKEKKKKTNHQFASAKLAKRVVELNIANLLK